MLELIIVVFVLLVAGIYSLKNSQPFPKEYAPECFDCDRLTCQDCPLFAERKQNDN